MPSPSLFPLSLFPPSLFLPSLFLPSLFLPFPFPFLTPLLFSLPLSFSFLFLSITQILSLSQRSCGDAGGNPKGFAEELRVNPLPPEPSAPWHLPPKPFEEFRTGLAARLCTATPCPPIPAGAWCQPSPWVLLGMGSSPHPVLTPCSHPSLPAWGCSPGPLGFGAPLGHVGCCE